MLGASGTAWILIGAIVLAALLLTPRIGARALLGRWRRDRRRRLLEDALKHLLAFEHSGRAGSIESLAGALGLSNRGVLGLVQRMQSRGLVGTSSGQLQLTSDGEHWALHVVRAHRLWERYLADEAGMPMNRLHQAAERAEHRLTAEQLDAIDAHLGYPAHDPHGDPIPTAAGNIEPLAGAPLTDWPVDRVGRIVHIEDEPDQIFRQILAEDLRPGQIVRVLERTPQRVVVSSGEHEHRLAPVVAGQIQVAEAARPMGPPDGAIRLCDLPDRASAEVVKLDAECRGFGRRRLLDMGITPGAKVTPELSTFAGDPRAIRVRGVLIALRREQAAQIWVRPAEPPVARKEVS